jgi:hypothetical protein
MNEEAPMAEANIVGIYDNLADTESAIRALGQGGFPINQVSIVTQNLESEKNVHGYVTTGDMAKEGAMTGAWVGGLLGLLAGAVFLWIPGWIPGFVPFVVVEPIIAALLGGVGGTLAGAAGGGLLGTLLGWGISKKHVLKYEEKLKGSRHLLVVNGTAEQIERARTILNATSTADANVQTLPPAQPALSN